MTEHQDDTHLLLWTSFKREADSVELGDMDAVIETATRLIADWGSNRLDMGCILATGVQQGELPEAVLARWDARWRDIGPLEVTPDEDSANRAEEPLPPELQPFERMIGEYSRKSGQGAQEMGRHLLKAKALCEAGSCSFETFLAQLHRRHGLNRATCYLYLKFAQWDFPPGLGTAVMKWIVQGFERSSAEAQQVIRAALEEALPLYELQSRYDRLRGKRPSPPQCRLAIPPHHPALHKKLVQKKRRLLAQREAIESQIQAIEVKLQQFALPPPPH